MMYLRGEDMISSRELNGRVRFMHLWDKGFVVVIVVVVIMGSLQTFLGFFVWLDFC